MDQNDDEEMDILENQMPGLPGSSLRYLTDADRYNIVEFTTRKSAYQSGKLYCKQRHVKEKCRTKAAKKDDFIHQYWRENFEAVVNFWGLHRYKTKIPITNANVLKWRSNLRNYGTVGKPRNTKGKKLPNILNASIDATSGSREHKLAVKRQRIEGEIGNVRGN